MSLKNLTFFQDSLEAISPLQASKKISRVQCDEHVLWIFFVIRYS